MKMETIKDICANYKDNCPWWADGGDCAGCPVGKNKCPFDRIEEAYEREVVTDCNTLNTKSPENVNSEKVIYNGAKMRKALLIVKRLFDGRIMLQPDIRKAHKAVDAALAAPTEPIGNAKGCETDDWLIQLVNLINGEVTHYMSQGTDYFSVASGPWRIKYDNTKGE